MGVALDGTVSLYSLDASGAPTLVRQNLPAAFSTDGTELDFRLPAAAVGNPSSISTLINVNYNTYLPNGFWMPPFTVIKPSGLADPAAQIGVTWTAADRIDRPADEPEGYQLYARADGADYAFGLTWPTPIGVGTTLWFKHR